MKKRGGGRLVLGALWALAAGFAALTALNHARVATGADRLEAMYRASPRNDVGRGECAAYAATQPPTMFDPDSLCWINLTQRQIADGALRPHDFPFDNAPDGRERHWSGSFSAWLVIVGAVARPFLGGTLAEAMTRAAAWANPALLVVFLSALAPLMRRKLGGWPTGILLVTLASMSGVEWDFAYGRPDHHGLHLMAFTGLVLGLLAGGLGWVRTETGEHEKEREEGGGDFGRPPTRQEARRWFTGSAVCGGVGLWIGSTQQCVCIGVVGAGAVLGALLFARRNDASGDGYFAPELWRDWARVGAATSGVFYLVEYFPSHLGMRLEVNHPLVALGWLGAGEIMSLLLMARLDWPAVRGRMGENVLRAGLGLAGMSALPLALRFGPKAWWSLGDPILLRSTVVISEGRPWIDAAGLAKVAHEFWTYTGALALVLPLAVGVVIWRRRVVPPWRLAEVTAMLVTAAVFLVWTLAQSRWMGFLETSLAVLAVAVAPCLPTPALLGWARRGIAVPVRLLLLTVPGWVGFGWLQARTLVEDPLPHAKAELSEMMSAKETAWNLRWEAERLGVRRPARVMCPPGVSPALHYYGGVNTVGSYYWENLAGCHVAVDFFTDEGEAEARRIVQDRQLDFVIVTTQPTFVLQMQWLKLGRTDVAAAKRTLAFRLANPVAARPPAWLEEVPLVDAPLARQQGVRIYRVVGAEKDEG